MKNKIAVILGVALLVLSGQRAFTADANTELKALVAKVQTDLKAGKKTEAELAGDLKQFDDLLAEHKGEKTDAVAQILFMKGMLYLEVIDDQKTGMAMLKQVKADYPDTKAAAQSDQVFAMMKKQEAAKKIKGSLVVGAKFPDFSVTSVDGKPLSVTALKGKVVLVDFWATWCPPCRAEIPNVVATYKKYHDQGFNIIGVSLDEDQAKLTAFTKAQDMAWPQYFDGKGWGNELAAKYGIESIPATFLIDGQGNIIGKDLRGEDLEAAVAKALGKS
jgi:thiol-disulfide isomerase/thioredoxin